VRPRRSPRYRFSIVNLWQSWQFWQSFGPPPPAFIPEIIRLTPFIPGDNTFGNAGDFGDLPGTPSVLLCVLCGSGSWFAFASFASSAVKRFWAWLSFFLRGFRSLPFNFGNIGNSGDFGNFDNLGDSGNLLIISSGSVSRNVACCAAHAPIWTLYSNSPAVFSLTSPSTSARCISITASNTLLASSNAGSRRRCGLASSIRACA
jgi:hypothetical protein